MPSSPWLPSRCLWLHVLIVITGARGGAADVIRLEVKEGSDVILPCSVSGQDLANKVFDWRKDGEKKKEVFLFDGGLHYNNGLPGQHKQFKGRVSHFEDQLKDGVASIRIRNAELYDTGNYTCDFPHLQPMRRSNIELVVGAIRKLYTTILIATEDGVLLQCEVLGAFPKPELQWQDGSGNRLPAAEPQVTQRGGRYDVTLQTNVTKTGRYRCVATQETIGHQVYTQTFVPVYEPKADITGWVIGFVSGAVAVAVLLIVLVATKLITVRRNKGYQQYRRVFF